MKHERELEPYLPTLQELNEMDLHGSFRFWIRDALREIPKRKVERDPLFHLKNEISQILSEEKSEEEKEREVLDRIGTYYLKYEGGL
ncbi:hypothetical protein ABND12_22510 [Paenibacillus larvae]